MQTGMVRCPICAAMGTVLAKYPERTSAEQYWSAFKMLKCSQGHFFTVGDRPVSDEREPRAVRPYRPRVKVASD